MDAFGGAAFLPKVTELNGNQGMQAEPRIKPSKPGKRTTLVIL